MENYRNRFRVYERRTHLTVEALQLGRPHRANNLFDIQLWIHMPQVRCSSTLTYGKHHLPFSLWFVARSQTCSIILYENFCQAQKQPQLSTQERKSDAHFLFFLFFIFENVPIFLFFPLCHVAYKSSHQCGCRCQAISLVQLRVSGPLLFRILFGIFFFVWQPFLLLSCTVSGLSRTAPGTLNSLCLWHKFACFPRKFFNLNRPRRVLARSHDAPTKEGKKI